MTWVEGCREVRQALGVYVLGSIDPAERSVVDRHLLACRDCRDELAGLAGLPALLGRVKTDEAEAIALGDSERERGDASAELLSSLLTRVAAERRMRRWRSVAMSAAAVVLAVVGVLAGLRAAGDLTSGRTPHIAWEIAHGVDARTGVSATVRYTGMPWGTMAFAHITGVRDGTTCQLWEIDASGKRILAGSWKFTYSSIGIDNGNGYPVASSDTASSVRGFDITWGDNDVVHIRTT
jgi:hypothetical protein